MAAPYRSAQKLRRDNCLSEITSNATLLATTLSNLGIAGSGANLDGTFAIDNTATPSKQIKFSAAGSTASTALTLAAVTTANRTITFPNASVTLASLTGTEALTNKTYEGNTLTPGSSTYTGTAGQTYTFPTTSATIARTDAANTFTGVQTMTSPAITTPALTGTVTGTYTLGGSPTIAGAINSDYKVLAASATYSATTTAATLTGFSWTIVPGSYVFDVELFTTLTTVGGLTVDFLLTTAVLTSIQYSTYASTATDNTAAVSTQGTTTTSATKVFDSKTAAYTRVRIYGSMVVGTGGTFAWQGTQNTSAGAGDASIVLLGSTAKLIRAA